MPSRSPIIYCRPDCAERVRAALPPDVDIREGLPAAKTTIELRNSIMVGYGARDPEAAAWSRVLLLAGCDVRAVAAPDDELAPATIARTVHEARPILSPRRDESRPLPVAERQLEQCLEAWPQEIPHLAAASSPGVGKTSRLARRLATSGHFRGRNTETGQPLLTFVFAASHALCKDIAEQLAILTIDDPEAPRILQWVGRTSEHRPMCRRPDAAARVARAGLSVRTALCRRPDGEQCPDHAACPYVAQERELEERLLDPRGLILVMPHASLPLPRSQMRPLEEAQRRPDHG